MSQMIKRSFSFLLLMCLFVTLQGKGVKQDDVIDRIRLAAQWQMDHPTDYGDLEWHVAPFYTALTDLYEVTGDVSYLEYLKAIGEKNKWAIHTRPYHADDHAVGLAYIKLAKHYDDTAMYAAVKKEFDWILTHLPEKYIKGDNGVVRKRYNRQRWNWCDALYMAPPVWAAMADITANDVYLEYMVEEWHQAYEWYWSEADSLFFHDRRDIKKVSLNGEGVFWARGDGWVHAGLVELLQYLPQDHKDHPFFLQTFQTLSHKLLLIQKENGTWAPSLLDPTDPAQDDISGSVFYVYGLAWGINQGWLDADMYRQAVLDGWQALCERQDAEGRLKNIQPVGGFPEAFDPQNTEIFGVGGFISAGTEVYKMIKK